MIERIGKRGKLMKKAALHNLGCKVNAYETEAMQEMLEQAGYEIVPFKEGADVYIINTCTVTNIADRKSRQMLHRARKLNPDAVVVAAGCYVQAQEGKEIDPCIDIVIGSARMFGVKLPENFRQPFASRNAAEFWRRWHITLGEWFKAYVFFPVSVSGPVKKWNRYGRKKFGKYITKAGASAMALFPVWLGNGLWHGARWSYIFFGMYYFAVLMAGIMAEPVRNKIIKTLHINEDASWFKALQIGKTWIIIIIGEMFFRANGLRAGIQMFQSMFGRPSGNLMTLGLDTADYVVILYGCAVVGLVGILRERNLLDGHMLRNLKLPVRWAIYYGLILAVLIFGAYGVAISRWI